SYPLSLHDALPIYRGRILWFLMTARPDLMPVDLKRQGRAEEHLALFAPHTKEERIELFNVMQKKTNLRLTEEDYLPDTIKKGFKSLSGADMEAALTRAKFQARAKDLEKVTPQVLDATLEDFLPPNYPEYIDLKTLSEVIECTSKKMLPKRYQQMERSKIMQRIEELKLSVG